MSYFDLTQKYYGVRASNYANQDYFDAPEPVGLGFSSNRQVARNSRERGIPERVDMNAVVDSVFEDFSDRQGDAGPGGPLQALEVAGKAPGWVWERPIATGLSLAGVELGTDPNGKSQVENAIGGIPVLGGILGGLGDVYKNVSQMGTAINNAGFVSMIRAHWNDAPDATWQTPDAIHGGKETWTAAKLKAEATKRGYSPEDVEGILRGTKGDFDFGDHSTGSIAGDLGLAMATDPLNFLIGTGVVSKAAVGVGWLSKTQKAGIALERALPATEAAEAIAFGSGKGATAKGLWQYFGNFGRGVSNAGRTAEELALMGQGTTLGFRAGREASRIGAAYRNLALGTSAAEVGLQVLDGTDVLGSEDTPLGGFMEGLYQISQKAADNHPLSDNQMFSLFSAFKMPFHAGTKAAWSKARMGWYKVAGNDTRARMINLLGEGHGSSFAARKAYVLEKLGGPDALDDMLYHTHASMLMNGEMDLQIAPALRAEFSHLGATSADELALKNARLSDIIDSTLDRLYKDNRVSGKATVEAFKRWFANRDAALEEGVTYPWNADAALQRWVDYREAAAPVAAAFQERANVVVGLSDVLAAEHVTSIKIQAKQDVVGTVLPYDKFTAIVERYPQLLQNRSHGKWFQKKLNAREDVPWANLQGKLRSVHKESPTLHELTHESFIHETRPSVPLTTPEGPITPQARLRVAQSHGEATIGVTRWRSSEFGSPTTIGQIHSARGNSAVMGVEENIGEVLDTAGFAVDNIRRTVGAWEGALEPSMAIAFQRARLSELRLAAAKLGKALGQDTAIITVSGAKLAESGLKPNGLEFVFTLPTTSPEVLDTAARIVGKYFPGFTIDDTAGVIRIAQHRDWMDDLTPQNLKAIELELAATLTPDVVGNTGLSRVTHQAYVEVVGDTSYGAHLGYDDAIRTAGADGRAAAFDRSFNSRLHASGVARVPGAGRPGGQLRGAAGGVDGEGGRSVATADVVGFGVPKDAIAQEGYLYKTLTPEEYQAALDNGLVPSGPALKWDDGTAGKRLYLANEIAEGDIVVRVKKAGRIVNDEVNQPYLKRRVTNAQLEVWGGDGQWHRVEDFSQPPLGEVPQDLQEALSTVAPVIHKPVSTEVSDLPYWQKVQLVDAAPSIEVADAAEAVIIARAKAMGLTPEEWWIKRLEGVMAAEKIEIVPSPKGDGHDLTIVYKADGVEKTIKHHLVGISTQARQVPPNTPGGRWLSDTRAELVPVEYLEQLPGGNRLGKTNLAELRADIEANGFNEAIPLTYATNGTILRDEGNHRLAVARELGYEAVPVRFVRTSLPIRGGHPVPGKAPNQYGYVPADLKPSEIGVPVYEGVTGDILDGGESAVGVDSPTGARDAAWDSPLLAQARLEAEVQNPVNDAYAVEALNQPAPQALIDAGLGDSSPLQAFPLADGRQAHIPGGLEGEFSLWDAWRLKAQQIDPNLLDEPTRIGLYHKIFRSQQRALSNPVDTFNRITFAMMSPNLNLLNNEAGIAAIRMSSIDDIRAFADMPWEDLVNRVKTVGAIGKVGTGPIKAAQANARRFLENPEWFNIREGEDLISYSERVMSVTDGAGMKVGNFAAMLGDPMMFDRGTIDSHITDLIADARRADGSRYVPEDVAARVKKVGNPKAKPISVTKYGQPNPDVPEHLRDLPWVRKDGKVMVYDSDYRVFSDALDSYLADRYPGLPFKSGGGQWFVWDMKRGIVEPHTSIWPGSHALPKMSPEDIAASRDVARAAGYYKPNPTDRLPYDPAEGIFFRQAPRGFDPKRAIEGITYGRVNDAKRMVFALKKGDPRTLIHEVVHVVQADLKPDELAAAQKLWGDDWVEGMAYSFETMLGEGKTTVPALQSHFQRIKNFVIDFYRRLKGTPVEEQISPEMRSFLDGLFMERLSDDVTTALRAIQDSNWGQSRGLQRETETALLQRLRGYVDPEGNFTGQQGDLETIDLALQLGREGDKAGRQGRALYMAEKDLSNAMDMEIPIPKYHGSLMNRDPDFKLGLAEIQRQFHFDGSAYILKASPKNTPVRFYREGQGAVLNALRARDGLAYSLINEGPLSPAVRLIDWLTTPVKNNQLARDARGALAAELIGHGASKQDIDRFVGTLNDYVRTQTIGPFHVGMYRGPSSLTSNTINNIAEKVFSRSVRDSVGPGNFAKLLDRSANRFIRTTDEKIALGTANKLETALNTMYKGYQDYLGPVAGVTRFVHKTFYHLFRFISDPRWWMMNLFEADILAGTKYTLKATRLGGANTVRESAQAAVHEGKTLSTKKLAKHQATVMDPLGVSDGIGYARNFAGHVTQAFDAARPQTIAKVLEELPYNDPALIQLRSRFGEENMVQALDDMLYTFDKGKGMVTVQDMAHELTGIRGDGAWDALVQKVWERNEGVYQDIVKTLRGNPNRTNLERIGNSWWLYWPLSYQIKATKWLYDVMTHKFLGKETNLAGANIYAQLMDKHRKAMAEDPEYAGIFADNEALWFTAQMLLPITPGDIGVSLGRPARYGGAALGLWGEYAAMKDPLSAAAAIAQMGPTYTFQLMQRIGVETVQDLFDEGAANVYPSTETETLNPGTDTRRRGEPLPIGALG